MGIANQIDSSSDFILAANAQDMARAQSEKMHPQTQDRLLLTAERIKGISSGVRQVAALENPLGKILREKDLPNGLHLEQRTVPFGVVGMVYEARPNVSVDAAVILLASGNAALLRGSSSAAASNAALLKVMRDALAKTSISPEVIQLVPSDDRATVKALLHARGLVDLVIPRGSAALIKMVVRQELRQLLVEVELTLLVVLVQLEIQVVQQQDRYLLMVHIYSAAHPVIKQIQKAAVVVVVVTTAVAVVRIKLQVVDQKTAAVVADRATLI
jgi:gamma-glutamyl phosphate reductase